MSFVPPTYRKQTRPNGEDSAFIEVRGRRIYLGPYGSAESHEHYRKTCAELEAAGGHLPVEAAELTVLELLARFVEYAKVYYGESRELKNYAVVIRLLRTLYGSEKAAAFGPLKLKAVRVEMIKLKWTRKHVNQQVGRIRRIFRWAVEEELIPHAVHASLACVSGLRKGRTDATEGEGVKPVSLTRINAAKAQLGRIVSAMVDVQLLTGMRAGELVIMRPMDLDRTGKVWLYTPKEHKTAWHGHERTIYIGPKAQAALAPLLFRDPGRFIFSPKESERERYAACEVHRHQPTEEAETERTLGDRYTVDSYRRAIERACAKAGIDAWTPHQLRHTAATMIRKEYGIDAARVVLGHRSPKITEVYAELDKAKGVSVMEAVG